MKMKQEELEKEFKNGDISETQYLDNLYILEEKEIKQEEILK